MNISRISLFIAGYIGIGVLSAQQVKSTNPTPVSNEINSQLPSWLRFTGEERARMEYIAGENFKPVADLYLLNRLRLNMDLLPVRWLKFSFQAQDSRVFGQNTIPAPSSQKDSLDLRVGYMQLGAEEGAVMMRAGRQGMELGDGRFVSESNWGNVGKSFDAARLTLRRRLVKLDLFTADVVKADPLNFDEPAPGAHFHGAYGSLGGLVPNAVLEPYVFWRLEHNYKNEAGKPGNLDEKTVGIRWAGKLPAGFDYVSEVASQTGYSAGDGIGAWTGHWVVGHTLADTRHRPRFYFEYNRASGDVNTKDGHRGNFDILFVGSHDKYGLTDLFCSSNIVHVRPGLQYTLRPGLSVAAAYNSYWLASPTDGLYVGGKIVARSPNGTAGTHVGQEADVQAQWMPNRASQFTVGYGRLFPGMFLQRTTTGVPYNIVFLNLAQRF